VTLNVELTLAVWHDLHISWPKIVGLYAGICGTHFVAFCILTYCFSFLPPQFVTPVKYSFKSMTFT